MCDFPKDMKLHTADEDVTVYKLVRVCNFRADEEPTGVRRTYRSQYSPRCRSRAYDLSGRNLPPAPLTLPRNSVRGRDVDYPIGASRASPFDESLGLMAWRDLTAARCMLPSPAYPRPAILRGTIPKGTRYVLSDSTGMVTTEILTVVEEVAP